MAANANDLFMEVGNPGTATTLSAPGYTAGGTTITVGSTSNWPTATGVIFAIDEAEVVDGKEVQIAGTYNEFVGTVSTGTSVTNVDWVLGSGDRNYSAGALTRVYVPVSATRENRLAQGMIVQHNQDGTHAAVTATSVSAGSVTSTGDIQLRSTSIETIRSETMFDYVASGGVWSGDAYASTRNASMTALTCYINGRRGTISAVTARSFTASKDTYVDVLNSSGTFSLVYTEVANNAASPALAANSIRIAIVVTGAGNIANVGSINQGEELKVLPTVTGTEFMTVTDSIGNLICPRDPGRRVLGYRQVAANQANATTTHTDVTGLKCPVIIPSGRKVEITAPFPAGYNSTATNGIAYVIYDVTQGAVISSEFLTSSATANKEGNATASVIYTPPASGSRTFKVQFRATGGGTANTNATTNSIAVKLA